jgi:hypothetical protein
MIPAGLNEHRVGARAVVRGRYRHGVEEALSEVLGDGPGRQKLFEQAEERFRIDERFGSRLFRRHRAAEREVEEPSERVQGNVHGTRVEDLARGDATPARLHDFYGGGEVARVRCERREVDGPRRRAHEDLERDFPPRLARNLVDELQHAGLVGSSSSASAEEESAAGFR